MPKTLNGVIPPIVTPFTDDRKIDFESLDRLVDYQIEGGVTGIFVLGSSGEVSFLSDSERDQVVDRVVARAGGRVPVLAGAIDTSSKRVLDQIGRLADRGVEYAVVTAPFYAKTQDSDIEDHFRAIGKASALPVMAYDIPVAVHSKLSVDSLLALGQDGSIVGVKDSSGDQGAMRKLIQSNRDAGSPLSIFTGTEVVVDSNLLMGVDGVVPGLGNVDPAAYVRLFNLARSNSWVEAKELQDKLDRLFRIVDCDPNLVGPAQAIGAFKQALKWKGILSSSATSEPLRLLSATAVEEIDSIAAQYFNG